MDAFLEGQFPLLHQEHLNTIFRINSYMVMEGKHSLLPNTSYICNNFNRQLIVNTNQCNETYNYNHCKEILLLGN